MSQRLRWTPADVMGTKAGKATFGAGIPPKTTPPPPQDAPRGVLTPPAAPIPQPAPPGAPEGHRIKTWSLNIIPMGAPRMVRSDRWRGLPGSSVKRRPVVQRYFEYREFLRKMVGAVPVPDELHTLFYIPMPKSWSKKKRLALDGKPHRQVGDIDNRWKAVADSLFNQDGGIWKGSQEKYWSNAGALIIKMVWHDKI